MKRRYPALLLERLNYDPDSPLQGRIRTPTTVTGTIKDNSILRMISASIEDGALYEYFNPEEGGGDTESMLLLLKNFWHAVSETFPQAWNESPRRSRLVHGVGIVSLGCLMDEIAYVLGDGRTPSNEEFAAELRLVADKCHWTAGTWRFSSRDRCAWNELQNIPRDILRLSDHLLSIYRGARAAVEGEPKAA